MAYGYMGSVYEVDMVRILLVIAFVFAVIGTILTIGKNYTNLSITHPTLDTVVDLLAAVLCSTSGVIAVMAILTAI